MKTLISSKFKYLFLLIIPMIAAIYFYPAKKIILNCKINTDNLNLNLYDKEDYSVLLNNHNIQRILDNSIKVEQNYGNNDYLVIDWMTYNYIINYNIFAKPLNIYHYTRHEKFSDIFQDDVWIQAYGEIQDYGTDVYDGEVLNRGVKISIVRETLELVVSTYPIDKFGLALNTSYNCEIAENTI